MSTKQIDTAADLVPFGASVKVSAVAAGVEDAQRAGDVEGMWARKSKGEPRLKCAGCGTKEAWLTILLPL